MRCCFFFFSSRRRHTRSLRDWSSDVCSSDLGERGQRGADGGAGGEREPEPGLRKDDEPQRARRRRRGRGEPGLHVVGGGAGEIGRASCRERVEFAAGGGPLRKKYARYAWAVR